MFSFVNKMSVKIFVGKKNIRQKKSSFFAGFFPCNKVNTFIKKNHAEKEAGKLVPDHFLFFKKTLC